MPLQPFDHLLDLVLALAKLLLQATEEFVVDTGPTSGSELLTYPAATADKSKAFLTVRENYADTPQPVPSTGWITPIPP